VPDDGIDRVMAAKAIQKPIQAAVLAGGIGHTVSAFQFNADGEIVATRAPLPLRNASVPGAASTRDALYEKTIAVDHEMRRDSEPRQRRIQWVRSGIERVDKEFQDVAATEMAGRQRDVVENDERHRRFKVVGAFL